MNLKVDPNRIENSYTTGIPIRAEHDGEYVTADIGNLDKESLFNWLRSRDGKNLLAENVVLVLLGHLPIQEEDRDGL